VALALAAAGEEVHVWSAAPDGPLIRDPRIAIHSLEHGFGARGLAVLARSFRDQPRPRRLLLQYVPHAFGMRALNVPLCLWVAGLRDTQVWVMFHEVALEFDGWRWRRAVAAATMRVMAALVLGRADRVFVSIPSWARTLRRLRPGWRGSATWLPIPSSLPTTVPAESRSTVRARLSIAAHGTLVGHFGTYGGLIAPLVKRALSELSARDPGRIFLLVGRGSEAFARDLERESRLVGRVIATGALEGADAAAHLAACDVLVQPFPDGISTRRTSAMAGLALGVPIASSDGWLTEPVWREADAVQLAATPETTAEAAEALLADPIRARAVGERGRALYHGRFSLDHTSRALRGEEPGACA
jgi:glycosyltransferase involved in cell wall biosynthesis